MDKDYAQYLLKKTTEDYNLIAGDFSRTRRYPWEGTEHLLKYIKAGDRVLDLGCGNGRLLDLLQKKDILYTGTDSSENLIKIAQKKHPGFDFQAADAMNLPFPDCHFDAIYSIAVLHHIPSKELRAAFLKEAKRVLRPSGVFVLTVWNLWQPAYWKTNLKYSVLKILGFSKLDLKDIFLPWGKSHQRYFHCFSQKELKITAERAGFEVKESGVLPGPDRKARNIYLIVKKPH